MAIVNIVLAGTKALLSNIATVYLKNYIWVFNDLIFLKVTELAYLDARVVELMTTLLVSKIKC
ncbi:hypothetical protein GFK82_00063 [Candidatus Steffania adelgidicola]|nr:hypothetical protein GFK82_00063 [Candidatus Steffania adelgidicola]